MVDGASFIGGAFQGDARHEGWGGFVEVAVCFVWCVGVVADAPGWAGGGWRCVVLLGVVWDEMEGGGLRENEPTYSATYESFLDAPTIHLARSRSSSKVIISGDHRFLRYNSKERILS